MLIRRTPTFVDRVFEDWNRAVQSAERQNALALDVHEDEKGYTIVTDLPGINSESIDIRLHDNVLTISAESTAEHQEANRNVLLKERRYGKFSRSLRFPVNVNSETIQADYTNGVLTVLVPKAEELKPRKIAVNVHNN